MWQPKHTISRPTSHSFSGATVIRVFKWVVSLGILMTVAYFLFWVFARWLVIKQISCWVVDQQLSDQECMQAAALKGKSMIFTRFDDAVMVMEMQKVTTANQLIYYTHLRKRLPDRMELHYEASQPKYLVSSDQTTWAAVNDRGALKILENPGELPKIYVSASWGVFSESGRVVDVATHLWILDFLDQAIQLNRPIAYIGLDDKQQISILFKDGRRILVTSEANPAVELTRLKLIEQESSGNTRFSGQTVIEIDLRFKFPVIRTKS